MSLPIAGGAMPEQQDTAIGKSKATRLVEYLTRVAQLRTKLIRDVGDYAHLFWVGEIPKQKGCYTRAWGPNEDYDPEVWIEVQNQKEPELPRVPAQCEEWVDRSVLLDTCNLPTLQTEITRQIENPGRQMDTDQPEFTSYVDSIEDHAEVRTEWDKYLEERWLPWAEKHTAWEAAHKTYAALFAIHQEQRRLGEEYELVLGIGLFRWQTPNGQRVRRHFLVANVLLEFEARLGKFTVRPASDGACLRPELDMLDIEEQPARAEETAKLSLADAEDNPWEKNCIEGVLQALVHSISSQGEYQGDLISSKVVPCEQPVVDFAPALILRKRSTRGLTDVLKRIRDRIELGGYIPSEFRDLAEMPVENSNDGEPEPSNSTSPLGDEVYFPKPSNGEQRRIVEVMRASNGVLVQGPPGTGKSHTIANLICHLLATGQRTLVTAKTPRALQVLQQLIPEELRPLCINLLGSGLDEKRSLEASVAGVLRKHERWSDNWAEDERTRLQDEFRQLQEEKAVIDRRLRDIREAETHCHSFGGGAYHGTAARIAEAVNRDRNAHEWCAYSAELDKCCPVSADELRDLLVRLREFTSDKRRELSCFLPAEVPSVQSFSKLAEDEEKWAEEEQRLATDADEQIVEELSRVEACRLDLIHADFCAIRDAFRRLSASPHPWLKYAIREILGGSAETWRELLKVTAESLSAIVPNVAHADDTRFTIVEDGNVHSTLGNVDGRLLYDDATRLKNHLEQGGKLGWWVFRPHVVKERLYLCNNVKVNGHACNSIDQLSKLVALLEVHLACDKAWKFWANHVEKPDGPYALQLSALKSLRSAVDDALAMEALVSKCRDVLQSSIDLPEPKWLDKSELDRILTSIQLAQARQSRRCAAAGLREIEDRTASLAARCDAHPTVLELLKTVQARDVREFARACEKLRQLSDQRAQLEHLDNEVDELRQTARGLAERLAETYTHPVWDARAESIQEAWHWDQARYWVEEHTRKEDASSLALRVRQIEDELNGIIAKLASGHAWSYCFSRLTEDHRRHMEAWQQSMRRLGKGTGKHAPRHRREAQQHLNECREAVPAWVMPLHRVWDTVDPTPRMFDVVIVDEASQCGVEALPLLYLARKVLIVGDDKQISPDAVGLPLDAVHRLTEEYLHDFRFKTVFGVESSLFDHGKLRYGTRRITLREHFRCMPEIIRFSNELCYSDTPLIPLRQYGPDRLAPLQHVFVERGYREGTGNRVVNRPEAESLVTKIVELCCDPRYNATTMGVVVLQGEAQAGVIQKLLLEQLGAEEMERRRLICGNSYSFQGDERDVMFLSMVAAPNERIGPLTKSADERRLNVAASRARDQLWLFHSVRCEDLSTSCLRRRLLEHFLETEPQQIGGIDREELERKAGSVNRSIVRPPVPFDSWFEVDVALQLVRRGFTVVPQYEVAGRRIDLVVEGGQIRLAVECDGDKWHGADKYEDDMQRQRMLERCGWEFFRVRESAFYSNRDASLQKLWSLLDERGIRAKGYGAAHTVLDDDTDANADDVCEDLVHVAAV